MPEISIVVPVYKAEQYLPQCIESILAQTFTDFELILVDDGSPDNSGAICDMYAEKDARIKVIHKENAGVSAARNSALDIASGTYLMFCDSDDWVEPEWCQCLYDAMQNPNVVMAVCGLKKWQDDTMIAIENRVDSNATIPLVDTFDAPISGALWNKIFILEAIVKYCVRFSTQVAYGEDNRFMLNYLALFDGEKRVSFLVDLLNNYRVIDGSLSHRVVEDYWELEKDVIELRIRVAKAHGVDLVRHANQLYYYCYRLYYFSIKNIFSKNNTTGFMKKYKRLKEIIKSAEFRQMQNSENFLAYPGWYRFILKRGWTFFIYMYHICKRGG